MQNVGSDARALTSADYRAGAIGIFATAMIVMASAHTANTSWNVNSRMALVFAVVDRGTFAIDGYHGDNDILPTGDKAAFGGHVYSDKAFGVSLLCVPVYAAMQAVARLFGFEWDLQWKIYLLRLVSTSIPAAIALSLLWLVMVRAGAMPRRALVAVAIAFFGSLWFGYSTLAMPYSPGIASCVAATYLLCSPPPGGVQLGRAAAIGFLCGFALICDFLFGPIVVAAIGVVFLVRLFSPQLDSVDDARSLSHPPHQARPPFQASLLAAAALAGALPLALFAAYTYSIFGTIALPYQYEVEPLFREGMSRGVMGVTTPRLGPLWFLTFHPFRGILFWSPWILIALAGCVMATRSASTRRTFGWMGLWAFGSALFITSGYYMWWGGFSMGARLMLPMMAAVPLGLTEVCRRERSPRWWWALVGTGVVSIVLSMPLALTDPQMPQIEDTANLLKVTLSDSLPVPQFEYLRIYYSGDWFWGPQSHHHLLRVLPLAGIVLASVVLIRTARRQPN
jgi:hypothetical protein